LNTHQQPKARQAITIACHQEQRPVMLGEDLPINGTGEAEKKTKFNLTTTNKGTEIKTDLKILFDSAFLFENTRI